MVEHMDDLWKVGKLHKERQRKEETAMTEKAQETAKSTHAGHEARPYQSELLKDCACRHTQKSQWWRTWRICGRWASCRGSASASRSWLQPWRLARQLWMLTSVGRACKRMPSALTLMVVAHKRLLLPRLHLCLPGIAVREASQLLRECQSKGATHVLIARTLLGQSSV